MPSWIRWKANTFGSTLLSVTMISVAVRICTLFTRQCILQQYASKTCHVRTSKRRIVCLIYTWNSFDFDMYCSSKSKPFILSMSRSSSSSSSSRNRRSFTHKYMHMRQSRNALPLRRVDEINPFPNMSTKSLIQHRFHKVGS